MAGPVPAQGVVSRVTVLQGQVLISWRAPRLSGTDFRQAQHFCKERDGQVVDRNRDRWTMDHTQIDREDRGG